MDPLRQALLDYADKYRVPCFLQREQDEINSCDAMADAALNRLNAMGKEEGDDAQRLKFALEQITSIYGEAMFSAGLSIGLELGRL